MHHFASFEALGQHRETEVTECVISNTECMTFMRTTVTSEQK